MARDVDYVVDTAADPVVTFVITSGAVASELLSISCRSKLKLCA